MECGGLPVGKATLLAEESEALGLVETTVEELLGAESGHGLGDYWAVGWD